MKKLNIQKKTQLKPPQNIKQKHKYINKFISIDEANILK